MALAAPAYAAPSEERACCAPAVCPGSDRKLGGSGLERSPMSFTPRAEVLPGSAAELRTMANDAFRAGEVAKAMQLYTVAIDMLAKGLARDANGVAADADLLALNKASEGQLARLLCNRSLALLRQGDAEAALEDADACTRADPVYEKGHLRCLAALEAAGAPFLRQLEACERGLDACPGSEDLVTRKWRLKKAIAALPAGGRPSEGERQPEAAPLLEETRRLADDLSDPRRAMAAADLGSVLATGSHGAEKSLEEAERYLRIGAEGGEVSAQRNLGLLLLELGRPAEAAQTLGRAAVAGDEAAASALARLVSEAQVREAEARGKLEELAQGGDRRAREMLEELKAH